MYYHNITHEDQKNGEGFRTVLWVSGCEHHCISCQNPQTWSYSSGIPFGMKERLEIYESLNDPCIAGITLTGGDPLAPQNIKVIDSLVLSIKHKYPNKTIWCYTGYKYEDFLYLISTYPNLAKIDVLVDGKFEEALKDIDLKWRGSSNQRVIDVQRSLERNLLTLYCD